MKVHIVVLSSTVIFTAVSYDVFNSHYITLVFVYIPDKKRNAYSNIFPFSLPFLVQVI